MFQPTDSDESINYTQQTILGQGRIYTLLCGSLIYGRSVDKSSFFQITLIAPNDVVVLPRVKVSLNNIILMARSNDLPDDR